MTQVWLKSIKTMSELFDKEVNAQKAEFEKKLPGFTHSSRKSVRVKMIMKSIQRNKKKNVRAR